MLGSVWKQQAAITVCITQKHICHRNGEKKKRNEEEVPVPLQVRLDLINILFLEKSVVTDPSCLH